MSFPVAIQKRGVRFFVDGQTVCPMKNCPPDWYLQWWKNKYRNWEPQTFIVFDTFLSKTSSFVDVGAWMGPTTLYAAAKSKHVYCFEPDPEAFRVLSLNLAVNLQYKNITAINAALSNTDGEITFGGNGELGNSESTMLVSDPDYTKKQSGALRTDSAEHDEAWRNSATVQVKTISMDTVEKTHDVKDCTFMKIDIEGGEKIVVPALQSFLQRVRPTLYLSIHWVYLTQEEIEALFDQLSALYPVMYDDSLLHRVNRDRLVAEKITSIVCMTKDLSILQKWNARWMMLSSFVKTRGRKLLVRLVRGK